MRRSCLLLGYLDGFQVWDVTDPDNVHEICSVRDEDTFGTVTHLHVLAHPHTNDREDRYSDQRPLLAVVSSSSKSTSETDDEDGSQLRLYSLRTQELVAELKDFGEEDEETVITSIKSNHRLIVLGRKCRNHSTLHILSTLDLTPHAVPLSDVFHDPVHGPTFALGSRFLAYATNVPVLNSDHIMTTQGGISGAGLGVLNGEKDVKGAAKDIAKEMVNGMKTISEYGYQTLSNYFSNSPDTIVGSPNSTRRVSMTPSPVSSRHDLSDKPASGKKKAPPSGMIMIRDTLKLPTSSRNLLASTIAHFRPHAHPVTCLTFNDAGTLLMSVSKQGHTFHIFSVLLNGGGLGNASHTYSLSRGYTDAQVEDCQFSVDSMWCAVSTARGTTHVYAINPCGGKPEITGHVNGRVNNPAFDPPVSSRRPAQVTSLGSVVRIKQRRAMPSDTGQHDEAPVGMNGMPLAVAPLPYQVPTPSTSGSTTSRQSRPHHRAKLVASFLSTMRTPSFVTNGEALGKSQSNGSARQAGSSLSSGQTAPLASFKNQASSLGSILSNFGSTVASTQISSLLPHQSRTASWTSAKDKTSDNRLFGFDEEESSMDDDTAKIINDEMGYQDLYSFHPSGVLTLHRCWVTKSIVKKREQGRNVEKLELSIKEEDVAEWRVARTHEWDQVKIPLNPQPSMVEPQLTKKSKKKGGSKDKSLNVKGLTKAWLSNAEIATYPTTDAALWTSRQFSFQTYTSDNLRKELQSGIIPACQVVTVRKEMPEPYSSRIDRVGKTMTRIANKEDENLDDALAELEENLSKAMQTSFTPSPTLKTPLANSPSGIKRLSSSAGAALSGSPMRLSLNRNTSLSFEDAYLISMGGAPGLDTMYDGRDYLTDGAKRQDLVRDLERSSLIQFDGDDFDDEIKKSDDAIRLEDEDDDYDSTDVDIQGDQVFSPDGDNEVAYPAESIFSDLVFKD
ncbi:hypothetical protein DFQ30_007310 [Apophysomyces sp. BC1015]|nr:hypothetical protein DFQ30_007310 [Apophysomyces sp. BC1015]